MKIKNREILIILISALILISVYTYVAKGAIISGEVSGYLILMDQKITREDYAFLREKMFSSIIYLPSEDCEGVVNYCSYGYKEDVNSNADVNSDGKIDETDIRALIRTIPCANTQKCWKDPIEECFFTISGRKFKDPSRDCRMNQTDIDLVIKYFGQTTNPLSTDCDNDEKCRSDVNKDGVIDIQDLVIVISKINVNSGYADYFERLVEHKSQGDVNKDGVIDIHDLVLVISDYSQEAIEQRCVSNSIVYLGGKKYSISAAGKGLYYAGVSYRCTV